VVALSGGGCAPSKGVKLTGQLAMNGAPYTPPDKAAVSLQFTSTDPNANRPNCSAEMPSGATQFEVLGPSKGSSGGIRPGKYKITVRASNPSKGSYEDIFKDAFSVKNSTLEYEVTADPEQSIVIDLGKKTVTKK